MEARLNFNLLFQDNATLQPLLFRQPKIFFHDGFDNSKASLNYNLYILQAVFIRFY